MKTIKGATIMRTQAMAFVLFGTLMQASGSAQAAPVPTWTVENVKMRMQHGDEVKERKVSLRFGAERMEIYSARKGPATLIKQLPYAEIEALNYAAFGGGMPGLGFLSSGRKHWLTIRCGTETALLILNKRNHEQIRQQVSNRTGVTVKHVKPVSSRSFHVPASL